MGHNPSKVMKHKTKHRHNKNCTSRERGGVYSTRRSRALDKMLKKQFKKLLRNKEYETSR